MANEVRIKLTAEQKAKIKRATGKVMSEIRVGKLGGSLAVTSPRMASARVSARAIEQASGRVSTRAVEQASGRVSARAIEQASGRVSTRAVEQASGRVSTRSTDNDV